MDLSNKVSRRRFREMKLCLTVDVGFETGIGVILFRVPLSFPISQGKRQRPAIIRVDDADSDFL